jgi:hypothetical protein
MKAGRGFIVSKPERASDGTVVCTLTVTRWRWRLMMLRALPRVLRGVRIAWR